MIINHVTHRVTYQSNDVSFDGLRGQESVQHHDLCVGEVLKVSLHVGGYLITSSFIIIIVPQFLKAGLTVFRISSETVVVGTVIS